MSGDGEDKREAKYKQKMSDGIVARADGPMKHHEPVA
jgi:hypothetical protein